MALVDIQVSLRPTNNLPEDWVTNTWHFDDGGDWDAVAVEVLNQLEDFYFVMRDYYPSIIAGNGHWMRVYRVSDPKPRAPIEEFEWAFGTAPSGGPIPTEVAAVLSYEAGGVSGIPQARRRGRIYLGPFNGGPLGSDGRFAGAFLTAVTNAADVILTASLASTTWKWSTHSKVLGTGAEVMNGWMDNEPDTQRRRGRAATARVTFP